MIQLLRSAFLFFWLVGLASAQAPQRPLNEPIPADRIVAVVNDEVITLHEPVSYTQLDVYKRQAVNEEAVPDVTPSLALRSSKRMETVPKDSTVPRPVFLSADRMGGEMEREFNAEGDSELRKIGTVLTLSLIHI